MRGYNGAKQLVGRKRHVLVDTQGLLQTVNVHATDSIDRDGIKLVLGEAWPAQLPHMRLPWLGIDYNGRGEGRDGAEQTTKWRVETVKGIHWRRSYWVPNDIPPDQIGWRLIVRSSGFHVVPRRWVVERAFAWLSHNRRLSKDHECLCATSEAWIYLAMLRRQLAYERVFR